MPIIIISVIGLLLALVALSNWSKQPTQDKPQAREIIEEANKPSEEDKIPSQVKSFLSDENIKKLEGGGMKIYTGDKPPIVEGSYRFEQIVFKYDPKGEDFIIAPYHLTFQNQKTDNTLTFSRKTEEAIEGPGYGEGKGVFISGEGNCFSVYLDNSSKTSHCKYKSVEIISACKAGGGLTNMDWGVLWTDKEGDCPKEVTPGYMRIFTQATLATKVE